jgi:hypothetical protein
MVEILDKLPEALIRKVFIFMSHPLAGLIKDSVEEMVGTDVNTVSFAEAYFTDWEHYYVYNAKCTIMLNVWATTSGFEYESFDPVDYMGSYECKHKYQQLRKTHRCMTQKINVMK